MNYQLNGLVLAVLSAASASCFAQSDAAPNWRIGHTVPAAHVVSEANHQAVTAFVSDASRCSFLLGVERQGESLPVGYSRALNTYLDATTGGNASADKRAETKAALDILRTVCASRSSR